MSHFLSSILSRHVGTIEKVLPRLPGSFEAVSSFPGMETAAFPFTHEMQETPITIGQVPEKNNIERSETKNDLPVFNQKPGTFLPEHTEKSSPDVQLDFHSPMNNNPVPNQFNFTEKAESRDLQSNYQDRALFNPTNGAEMGPERVGHETLTDRVILTETLRETKVQEFESGNIQPAGDTDGKEQMSKPPVIPTDYIKASLEAMGALGDPPGRMNGYNNPGKQETGDFGAEAKASPIIKVSIGQIHIRALMPPSVVTSQKPRQANKPLLTLEDYLKGRG